MCDLVQAREKIETINYLILQEDLLQNIEYIEKMIREEKEKLKKFREEKDEPVILHVQMKDLVGSRSETGLLNEPF